MENIMKTTNKLLKIQYTTYRSSIFAFNLLYLYSNKRYAYTTNNKYNVNTEYTRISLFEYNFIMPEGMISMPKKLYKKCELEKIPLNIYVYKLDEVMFNEMFEHCTNYLTSCNTTIIRAGFFVLKEAETFEDSIILELTSLFSKSLFADGLIETNEEQNYLMQSMFNQMLYLACTNYPIEGYDTKYKSDPLTGIGKLFYNWQPIITPRNTNTYTKFCTRLMEIARAMRLTVIRFQNDLDEGEPTMFY